MRISNHSPAPAKTRLKHVYIPLSVPGLLSSHRDWQEHRTPSIVPGASHPAQNTTLSRPRHQESCKGLTVLLPAKSKHSAWNVASVTLRSQGGGGGYRLQSVISSHAFQALTAARTSGVRFPQISSLCMLQFPASSSLDCDPAQLQAQPLPPAFEGRLSRQSFRNQPRI